MMENTLKKDINSQAPEREEPKSVEQVLPKMVERENLMTGKKYLEAEDTPLHLSPASETFWSM